MPKKILFFLENLWNGGKERRFSELVQWLKTHTDYKIHIVLLEEGIFYSNIIDLGIPVTILKRIGFKMDPSVFYRFYRIVKHFNPDIIHTWGLMSTTYAIPAKLLSNRPLLTSFISNSRKQYRWWSLSNFLFKMSCYISDRIISNSFAGLKAYEIHSQKGIVIHNGVNLERFNINEAKGDIRKEIGLKTRIMIIMVACMRKDKNFDLLLDIAKHINGETNDITFVVVGGGSEFARIQRRVNDEKIENLLLLGTKKDVERLIYASDVGILLTNTEGISNSIIEYMASSKPVITNDTKGGSCELIEDRVSGYILESNVSLISEKIIELTHNRILQEKMGTRGREIVGNKFSIDRMGKDFFKLYKDI